MIFNICLIDIWGIFDFLTVATHQIFEIDIKPTVFVKASFSL